MMMLCLCFSYIQKQLLHEREKREQAETAWRNRLQKCRLLFNQLQECNLNLPYKDEDMTFLNSSSLHDAFDQLTVSDDQIDILLAEVNYTVAFYPFTSYSIKLLLLCFKYNSFMMLLLLCFKYDLFKLKNLI